MADEKNSTIEAQLLRHMLGGTEASVLMTDAYKFAMAQAGDPLRPETFYLSCRRKGAYYLPFDLGVWAQLLQVCTPSQEEMAYLDQAGYGLSAAMLQALAGQVEAWAPPAGTWLREGEPMLRLSGPSFLVSWLEAITIWLNFPIQIASAALAEGERSFVCSCEDEAKIVELTLATIGVTDAHVEVAQEDYRNAVRANAEKLATVLGGSLQRVFEVGMRGVTCMQMHRVALEQICDFGVAGSSNLYLAKALNIKPVGTTGHEHQLRYSDDQAAFRAIRDGRQAAPSYLFDTYDALALGIPAAVEVLREQPGHLASVRFDSGEVRPQMEAFLKAQVTPSYIFMDGIDAEKAKGLSELQEQLAPGTKPWLFGVGGYLVANPSPSAYTRNRVSAVYKLSETGGRAVMKFSVPGKESLPGRPVIWRRQTKSGLVSVIAQQAEPQGKTDMPASATTPLNSLDLSHAPIHSQATQELIDGLRAQHMPSA